MRSARVKMEGGGYYHCMSRVIERRMILGKPEKEVFRRMMRKVEGFCGVKILTYAIMSNHFHILTHVPPREEISDEELVRRLGFLYGKPFVDEFAQKLETARKRKDERHAKRLREKYLYRMYEVSEFMKTLKQRFTMWYNRNHKRRGTLWEERFKSILVQDSEHALVMMASYIDLNPVRAGLVSDPKVYRFSGYGEAVGGSKVARAGLGGVMLSFAPGEQVWGQISHKYRTLLYVRGQQTESKAGFSYEEVQEVLHKGGKLSQAQALRCRVRYFSDGVVLGSKSFVEEVFKKHRGEFGLKRKTGARAMKAGEWGGLCTMRDLRLEVVTVPAGVG